MDIRRMPLWVSRNATVMSNDIVKAVIEEINLHNCSINTIVEYMNLVKKDLPLMK